MHETGPALGDAFGEALRRCHAAGQRPGTAFEVIERSDGLIGVGDAVRYFGAPATWPWCEREVLPEISGRVLDVGCGAGRHAVALSAAGSEVVGVDSSPGAVEVARDRGVDARIGSATALPGDIGRFTAVLLLGHNLGLLGNAQQAPRVPAALAEVAEPGARLIGSGLDPHATSDPEHRRYHEANRRLGQLPGQVSIRVRHGRLATPFFDYLFCSEAELRDLVDASPWRLAELLPEPGGSYAAIMALR